MTASRVDVIIDLKMVDSEILRGGSSRMRELVICMLW